MARLTVSIDDELINEAREALGARTKRETIIVALREATRRRRLARALARRGRVDLELTGESLAELREAP